MFRLLPKIPLPHLLRPGPEQIDTSFLDQPLDQGLRNRVGTLADKAGLSRALADRLAEAHVAADEAARVEVSRPNQVTGLRRLVLMGPAYHRPTISVTLVFGDGPTEYYSDDTISPLTLIGVTGDGLLFRRGLYTDEGAPSAREGLRLARREPDRLLSGLGAADPGLNRYNGGASVQVRDATDQVLRMTSAVLTEEERAALPYRFLRGLEHVTRARIARRVALARYALNDALDPDLLRLMRGCALQSLAEAEWVCGAVTPETGRPGPGRWFGAPLEAMNDRDLSRARVQAIRAYPALAKVFYKDKGLRHAIDARAPLAPVIAAHLRVEESGIRLLNGVTWQRAAVPPTSPEHGLARLASVPRELAPVRRAEHRQLPLIAGFSDLLKEPLPKTLRRFAKGGSPYRFPEELTRVSPGDMRDAAEYLVDKLLFPARLHAIRRLCEADGLRRSPPMSTLHGGMVTDLLRGMFHMMSIRDMFALSDRWHRNLERHEDRLVTLHSEVSWAPFLGEADLGGEVRSRELNSAEALKRQGKREGHCVGGYTDKLLRAGPDRIPLIFSLERGGTILGTAEISLRRSEDPEERSWEAELLQNRARHNGPVCKTAVQAAEALCRALEAEAPERALGYLEGVRGVQGRRSRHGALPAHLRAAGYDIWEPGRLEAAWTELSGYLPRAIRKAGLEALIRTETDRYEALYPVGKAVVQPFTTESRSLPFWEKDAAAIARACVVERAPDLEDARRPEEEACVPF